MFAVIEVRALASVVVHLFVVRVPAIVVTTATGSATSTARAVASVLVAVVTVRAAAVALFLRHPAAFAGLGKLEVEVLALRLEFLLTKLSLAPGAAAHTDA